MPDTISMKITSYERKSPHHIFCVEVKTVSGIYNMRVLIDEKLIKRNHSTTIGHIQRIINSFDPNFAENTEKYDEIVSAFCEILSKEVSYDR